MKVATSFSGKPDSVKTADFVAIVSDPGSRDVIGNLLRDQGLSNAHLQLGTFEDTIRLLQQVERSPKQLIVDVSHLTMPLSDLTRLSQVCEPSIKVVAIGDKNDVGLFRNLLRIGVQDYLVKPLTVDLLRRSLASNEPVLQVRTGKVLSFIGARGGVGVTTIAVCLARHLSSETRRRIAYVDLNLNGGAAGAQLGISSNNGLTELLQLPRRPDASFIDRALVTKTDRLFLLSAELPYGTDPSPRAGAVGELVDALKQDFHYILLDVPRVAGRVTEEALDASNFVYLVSDRSVHAARECARLIRLTQELAGERVTSVLLNNPLEPVDGRVEPADFEQVFGRTIAHELPYAPKALALAENLGEPIGTARDGGFLSQVAALARDITGEGAPAATRWYARLTRRWG
ncbi:AAA family ATPase [Trinickia fusca]|uniref:Fimbrial protein n=1 Tax=Trinickia fusca TaxID=2419777 RepID=A0A494XW31_9BURK|nr:AAA family ATPase [Trinickia fusca]RKP52304.1 fimbrial protein [Trinickia fusca]